MKYFLLNMLFCFGYVKGIAQMDSALCKTFKVGRFAYRDDSAEAILINRTYTRH